jgi:hypothetical protein
VGGFDCLEGRGGLFEGEPCARYGSGRSLRSRYPSKPRLPGFAEESIRKARNALPLAPNGIGGHAGLKLRHCEAVPDRVDIGTVSGIALSAIALIAGPIGIIIGHCAVPSSRG